jgi:hypothetical protein
MQELSEEEIQQLQGEKSVAEQPEQDLSNGSQATTIEETQVINPAEAVEIEIPETAPHGDDVKQEPLNDTH